MKTTKTFAPNWYNTYAIHFFRLILKHILPASWFRSALPKVNERNAVDGFFKLEIVSHCWGYSNMLAYQLSSFINYPPKKCALTVTVFYAKEDTKCQAVLDFFSQKKVENVTWNFQALPKEKLFRRAIGRNMVARSTDADWLWFTDCDIIFHENCLDSLAEQLQGKKEALYYPRQECTTEMLAQDDPMLRKDSEPQLVNIDTAGFSLHSRDKAKGAFQIVHGDVARAIGYCDGLSIYQTLSEHWCKCYEDREFRWLLGSEGVPLEVDGVYQIRHVYKGRYKENTFRSKLRSKIRRIQE
ncbi:glycosyltransferase family 2 protein [Colwellia sp. 1_MG-2023]|uniref:glycosyltransferase family 2 protein n=1 Tax=unclassified Colwellia TaxID=196834 RepID=UPI001C08D5D9|nr:MULTISPECIES: glycosyltransferase family 2 protein [unclassified Colwellia]MBU2925413.1 glycosyltransferase family 2 protein [Colwellia sp. C2M11]MDO6653457.1 glycosyltransferase family 2 protein [Colwellia sp. 3_MG-2023]MDO6666285.1 glycosyltransferase family 2 protein [Colwellia sp. 2_MG-2023]MDO6690614.1 glycosyltransferase family 2 protein [Colwellia sp. 1_MG-2023]